ncbi:hypothetical protein L7F22_022403 [Adiantum nelumboides]|nr:hypothetical protein [Adiantum nelumboides]
MAPEWLKSDRITSKADVYSYGMLLLELVHGLNSRKGDDDISLTAQTLVPDPEPVNVTTDHLTDSRLLSDGHVTMPSLLNEDAATANIAYDQPAVQSGNATVQGHPNVDRSAIYQPYCRGDGGRTRTAASHAKNCHLVCKPTACSSSFHVACTTTDHKSKWGHGGST